MFAQFVIGGAQAIAFLNGMLTLQLQLLAGCNQALNAFIKLLEFRLEHIQFAGSPLTLAPMRRLGAAGG